MLRVLASLAVAQANFYVIGDWGGESSSNPANAGERAVAKGMAARGSPEFVLAVGDNFYEYGLEPSSYVDRFQETFETVFTAKTLDVPFYALCGNHDHRGNVQVQVQYAKNESSRWTMPDLFYTFTREVHPEGCQTCESTK